MRHLWQWFCGYVQICLHGRQVNRFMNLCSRNGIILWRISYDLERKVRAYIRLKDFYLLKPYLKKTKTHLHIINKKGFPFWCFRHPILKWMIVIVFIGITIWFYSFTFIWNVQINGNDRVSTNELKQYLKTQDISTGIKSKEIDCTKLEYLIRKEFQEIGWVSAYIDSTCLYIDIKESLYDEFDNYPIEDGKAYHLTANKDAIIESIITQKGTPVVTAGTVVHKGDLLVLGHCVIFDDIGEMKEVLNVQAKALIYGDVQYQFISRLNELEIMALRIADKYNNKTLAFIANQKMLQFIRNLEENGVIILDKNVMIDKKDKNMVFISNIKAREQIGINIPVEEVWEYESE